MLHSILDQRVCNLLIANWRQIVCTIAYSIPTLLLWKSLIIEAIRDGEGWTRFLFGCLGLIFAIFWPISIPMIWIERGGAHDAWHYLTNYKQIKREKHADKYL